MLIFLIMRTENDPGMNAELKLVHSYSTCCTTNLQGRDRHQSRNIHPPVSLNPSMSYTDVPRYVSSVSFYWQGFR